ncbi:MAG TPA: hypothetical protein EYG69_02945 [Campylobacterales bacterium]|nr:hypothetical protein [Campylobacterales bacterium]
MKQFYILFITIFIILLSGCSSKTYFEPSSIAGKIEYKESLNSLLKDVSRDGATFADGQVVTKKSGLLTGFNIPSNFKFLSDNGSEIAISDIHGNLKILSKNDGSELFSNEFSAQILSCTKRGNFLAMLDSNNALLLYDISASKLLYKEKLEDSVAVDARVANPLFLNDLVVFPTLDGRLLIMDLNKKRILRDIAISDRRIFNNVIFLGVHNNIMVAATSSKVISITPTDIKNYKVGVKDILYIDNQVYIFTKAGSVILLDNQLQKISELKLPFAIFSTAFSGNMIYAVEKKGFIIEIQKDLSSHKVYELADEVNVPVIGYKGQVFIGDKVIYLP